MERPPFTFTDKQKKYMLAYFVVLAPTMWFLSNGMGFLGAQIATVFVTLLTMGTMLIEALKKGNGTMQDQLESARYWQLFGVFFIFGATILAVVMSAQLWGWAAAAIVLVVLLGILVGGDRWARRWLSDR